MEYTIIRTDTADDHIRNIIMYIAVNFGNQVALEKLNELENQILNLKTNPYLGMVPRYKSLRYSGYRVLVLKKNLVFYKVNEINKEIIIYAVIDQRQDYLNIIRGL